MVKPTAVADCGGSCRTDMLYRRARCIIGQYTVALYKRLYSSGSLNTAIQNVSIASSIEILYRPIQQIQYTAIQPIHCTALYTPPLTIHGVTRPSMSYRAVPRDIGVTGYS